MPLIDILLIHKPASAIQTSNPTSMKTLLIPIIIAPILFLTMNCNDKAASPDSSEWTHSGFRFPTDSNTINAWISSSQDDSLAHHTWEVWNMINQPTNKKQQGLILRDWMTWKSPNQIKTGSQTTPQKLIDLNKPRQFHATSLAELDPAFYVTVQYNDPAVQFVGQRNYLSDDVLQKLLENGNTSIQEFPDSSIAIKPVFYVISQDDDYGRIPVWKGPPASPGPYPSNEWNNYVYIDLQNNSAPTGMTCDSTETNWESRCSYNLSDFIYYRLTEEEVKLVEQEGNQNIQAGDYAVLVAMHLTTKEIRRWTWQTFFWAPDPDNPFFPSSAKVAEQRKFITDPAVSHYATTIAYQMIDPVQPYAGGNIIGEPVYAFNPYLEAPFDFGPDQDVRLPGIVQTSGGILENKFGIQTNCMSCHALSHYFKTDTIDNDFYIADTYVDMEMGKVITSVTDGMRDSIEIFVGKLKTDFLWSIPDIANNDQN